MSLPQMVYGLMGAVPIALWQTGLEKTVLKKQGHSQSEAECVKRLTALAAWWATLKQKHLGRPLTLAGAEGQCVAV